MIKNIVFSILLLLPLTLTSQSAGKYFAFGEIPTSVSSAALGGSQISSNSGDVNQLSINPAFLDSTLDKSVSLAYLDYLTDIKQTTLSYAQMWKGKGLASGYFRYLDYGTFIETDEFGTELKEFKVSEYEFGLTLTRSYSKRLSYGVTLKNYFSGLYNSFSYGFALNLGGYYQGNQGFTAGVTIDDLGLKVIDANGDGVGILPATVNVGISKKFNKAPIRFGVQFNHLEHWDLASLDADGRSKVEIDALTGDSKRKVVTLDNLARHMTFSVAVEPSEKFAIMSGFNVRRRLELAASQRPALVGFSLGVQFKIKRFNFQYAVSSYHINSASNHLALTTNLNQWYTKKNLNLK